MVNTSKISEKLLAFFKIKFVKDTLILQAGTVVTMGANLATSVLLARILQPERYGIYALVFSLYGLIGLFGNVGVGLATVTRLAEAYAKRDEEEVTNLLAFFVKMSAIMAVFILVVGFLLSPYLASKMYDSREIGHIAQLLFLIAPLGIMYGLVTTILQSVRMMQQLTILESLMTILTSVLVIGFVLLGLGVNGIVYGHVLATLFSSAMGLLIYHRLRWQLGSALPSLRRALKRVWQVRIKEYFGLGFLIAVDKNIGKLYTMLPIVFLGIFAIPREVSHFKIAYGAISLLKNVTTALGRNVAVKLPEIYAKKDIKHVKRELFKILKFSLSISIGLTFVFLLLSPWFIGMAYGNEYISAINNIYILGIYSGLAGAGVVSYIFRTINRVEVAIKIGLVTLLTSFALGLTLVKEMGALGAAILVDLQFIIPTALALLFVLNYKREAESSSKNLKVPTKKSELEFRQRQAKDFGFGHLDRTRLSNKEWLREHLIERSYLKNFLHRNIKPILDQISNQAIILEIGAGNCWVSALIRQISCANIVAIDFSSELLDEPAMETIETLGLDRESIERVVADWDYLPFKDKSIELIVGSAVLHHAEDLEHLLKEMHRVLKDDGSVYIQREAIVPWLFSSYRRKNFGKEERALGVIEKPYTLREWRQHFQRSGFTISTPLPDGFINRRKLGESKTLKSFLKRLIIQPLFLFNMDSTRFIWLCLHLAFNKGGIIFVLHKKRSEK